MASFRVFLSVVKFPVVYACSSSSFSFPISCYEIVYPRDAVCPLTAFLIWGLAPLYFKHLSFVPADEIVTHRIIWLRILILLVWWTKSGRQVIAVLHHPRGPSVIDCDRIIDCRKLFTFIWAINHGHMLESSSVGFINPLLNILLGMLF